MSDAAYRRQIPHQHCVTKGLKRHEEIRLPELSFSREKAELQSARSCNLRGQRWPWFYKRGRGVPATNSFKQERAVSVSVWVMVSCCHCASGCSDPSHLTWVLNHPLVTLCLSGDAWERFTLCLLQEWAIYLWAQVFKARLSWSKGHRARAALLHYRRHWKGLPAFPVFLFDWTDRIMIWKIQIWTCMPYFGSFQNKSNEIALSPLPSAACWAT